MSGNPFSLARLPHAAAYVASLPEGLASHPAARVRTEVSSLILERFPHIFEDAGLDAAYSKLLRTTITREEWMSDAEAMSVRMLLRDVAFARDADFLAWSFETAGEVFARPLYRMLMHVLSPSLVLMGATKRWAAFRSGTTLTSKVGKKSGVIDLTFPRRLYNELALRGFGEAFRAALTAARAADPKLDLERVTDESARWTVGWNES